MCCFSGQVETVGDTRIFAGPDHRSDARQVLVYEMAYVAADPLAMVLPLPVPPGSAEDALEFIDLSRYPEFFEDLERGLVPPDRGEDTHDLLGGGDEELARPRLVVHDVGDFEASFVPTRADFARLEPRFRLPAGTWDKLPAYADYGFAVFKLKAAAGGRRVHPMAMSFPRRDAGLLFFPTVHIHDGMVHGAAVFDHSIYLQPGETGPAYVDPETDGGTLFWTHSYRSSAGFIDFARMDDRLMEPRRGCARLHVKGRFENKDITIGSLGSYPQPLPEREARRESSGKYSAEVLAMLERFHEQARAAGAAWMVLNLRLQRPCRNEAEVAEALTLEPLARVFDVAEPFADQGGGLSRFHWNAGDRR